jgi:hypothetical protein
MISSANFEIFSTAPSSAATAYSSSTADSLLSPTGGEVICSLDRSALREFPFVLLDLERMNWGKRKTVPTVLDRARVHAN